MNSPVKFPAVEAKATVANADAMGQILFRPMGVDGVVARTGIYENVVDKLARLISGHRDARAEILRFPPVMSRAQVEKSGYLKSFPNLLGCVCALHGSEAEIIEAAGRHEAGGEWTSALTPSDLVLSPAACYPVYPIAAARGPVPREGYIFDIAADVFRHEPSANIDRFQSFRMREYVCIGTPDHVLAFREAWMTRAKAIADNLGLTYDVEQASDPFFGRVGQKKAVAQLLSASKFELLIPVRKGEAPTACMSFNAHKEHFGSIWDMKFENGEIAHSACVAFGMDRLAVALFATHGLDTHVWPAGVKAALDL